MASIRVFAPATVANVACGFDIFGLAVDSPGDEVIIRKRNDNKIVISKIEGDGGKLPYEAEKNAVSVPIIRFLDKIESRQGFDIELYKKMPLGSGLGSSSASSVAGVFAINELLGKPLMRQDLLPFAMEGERVACGSAHADNVAPALLGGFVVVRSYNPIDIFKVPTPEDLYISIAHPGIEVNTKDARHILRNEVPMRKAIAQMGNVAGMIAGLMQSDYNLIGRSMVDFIIEPVRSILIPQFFEVKQAALEAGALGCSISGAGPSVFALSKGQDAAQKIAQAMCEAFAKAEINSHIFVSKINEEGPKNTMKGQIFYKYQGTGNDFVMIDNRGGHFLPSQKKIEFLCHRRFGIGADGLILLENEEGYEFRMRYFNADGTEGSMCGNGGRCAARFAHDLGIFSKKARFLAVDGEHEATINADLVCLKMIDVTDIKTSPAFDFLNTGSPHYIKFVEDVQRINVVEEGRKIRHEKEWAEKGGTNVNFVQLLRNGKLHVRTYERGVEDETYSCGTGTVASSLAVFLRFGLQPPIEVQTKGGDLRVKFKAQNETFTEVYLEGAAECVYEGIL